MAELPEIRKARNGDGGPIAALHCRRILTGLLTALGEPFTASFYEAVIGSPGGFAYVATHNAQLIGFASGLVDGQRFYQEDLHPSLRAIGAAAMASLIQGQWGDTIDPTHEAQVMQLSPAEVVSLAVEGGAQEDRTSVTLMRCVLDEFAARGVTMVRVTAETSNDGAIRLYEKAGFHRIGEVSMRPAEKAIVYQIFLDAFTRTPSSL